MAQHDRNLLKRADIQRFQQWLDGNEWRVGKGDYQLMQVKLAKGWGAICFDAAGVLTTPTEIAPLIKQFKSGKPRHPAAPIESPAAVVAISDKQYLADLRDDFALAAMQGLMARPFAQDERGRPFVLWVAEVSYELAEAMLAERKKRT